MDDGTESDAAVVGAGLADVIDRVEKVATSDAPVLLEGETGSGQELQPSATSSFPTLADAMREHIGRALAVTHGRIEGPAGAAALLGLNPHTLRGKMRKLGIDWARYRYARGSLR